MADTSVSAADPEAPGDAGSLAAGGPDGQVAFITFQVEGIGAGTVVSAQLVLTGTGDSGGATGTIGVLGGVWTDEGWTYASAPVSGASPAVGSTWVDPWAETAVDVTGTVGADGTKQYEV